MVKSSYLLAGLEFAPLAAIHSDVGFAGAA